jgi:two-component system nitrate/nitrite response regulator NarL
MSVHRVNALLPRTYRLLLVDDGTPPAPGLAAELGQAPGLTVAGSTRSVDEAVREAARLQPDAVLLDLHAPGNSTAAALDALRAACPGARVLVLASAADAEDLAAALRAGADGYLVKNIDARLLLPGLRRALNGEPVLERRGAEPLDAGLRLPREQDGPRPKRRPRRGTLSPREREILGLVAQGHSNKQIGKALGVAESTVKIHVRHILQKLQLSSRVQAAVYASKQGMVKEQPA